MPGLFKNQKFRVLFLLILFIALIAAGIIYWRMKNRTPEGAVSLAQVPHVKTLPGVGEASEDYIKKVQEANRIALEKAAEEGGAAIPTITRAGFKGPAGGFEAPESTASKKECDPEALKRAKEAGVTTEELRCAGCTATQLRAVGYTAGELHNAGFNGKNLRDAGFTEQDLKDAGFAAKDLLEAGFSPNELKAIGLAPEAVGAKRPNCNESALSAAKKRGISAAQLRKEFNCDISELKVAGFAPKDFRDAGFTPKDLSNIGLSAKQLKEAGFTPAELKATGFNAADLRDAGFIPEDLKEGGYTEGDLIRAGFTPTELGLTKPVVQAAMPAVPVPVPPTAPLPPAPGAAALAPLPTETPPVPVVGTEQALPSITAEVVPSTSSGLAGEAATLFDKVRKQRELDVAAEQQQEMLSQLQQAMANQASEMLSSWSPPPTQIYVPGTAAQRDKDKVLVAEGVPGGPPGAAVAAATAAKLMPESVLNIKAGDVMFAVLETGVNSDEQSPIMAQIVGGPLRGARLLGRFDRVKERVVLAFNLMSVPWLPKSINVNTVAIDPDTAKTAMADSVDRHFLLRYGGLFAASFLSGLATAISESGSQIEAIGLFPQKSMPVLSSGQKALVALGEVGTQFSSFLREKVNTPPTVEVFQGSSLGILFMSDVAIPKKPEGLRQQITVSKSILKLQRMYENGNYVVADDDP
jgi:intracellular multiplication protein IcmE